MAAQLDEADPDVRLAVFGKQVEDFFETDIGNYILKRAQAEIDNATRDLRDVDPTDTRSVMKAQLNLKVAESVIKWLGDAIVAGQSSLRLLQEEQ